MTNDFFSVERAAQIQRLAAAQSGNRIEVPGRFSRFGMSRGTRQLFRTIDRICRIPLGKKRKKWLDWLAARGGGLLGQQPVADQEEDDPELLKPDQRAALNALERQLVELRLGHDADASKTAEDVIAAILKDHRNFSGLKPLQFHSDNFAYECLFPSWMNLYAVLACPTSESSEPRFSEKQVKTIFRFLRENGDGMRDDSSDAELVGAFTLTANRLPPTESHLLIQRMMDLCCLESHSASVASAARLSCIREQTGSAAECLSLLTNLAAFESSEFSEDIVTKYSLGVELPSFETLPQFLTEHVRALEGAEDKFDAWAELVGRIGRILEAGGGVNEEFAELLQRHPDSMGDWLALLTSGEAESPLSSVAQKLLACMIQSMEGDQGGLDFAKIQAFACHIAPRLDVLSKSMASYFEKEFISNATNRELLLRSAADHKRRQSIAEQMKTLVRKTQDQARLLSLLTIAAILDPDCDAAKIAGMRRTISVLEILEEQGYISSNQLEELAHDIRRRLPQSVEFLVSPHLGALGQEGRLAKLYMALYEECEKYEHYGEIGNFGLTTAAYGNLNRSIDREI